MNTFLKLVPFIVKMIGIAEYLINKPKSGSEKKALVMESAKRAKEEYRV